MVEQLAQYGAIGIVLAVILGLFLWAFKRLFEHVLQGQAEFKIFMDASVKAMEGVREEIRDGNLRLIERIDDLGSRKWFTRASGGE